MIWLGAALLFCYAGWAGVALAMNRHHQQVWRRPSRRFVSLSYRLTGTALLGAAFAACVAHWGWAIGPVGWFGTLSATALALVLSLAYRPRAPVTAERLDPAEPPSGTSTLTVLYGSQTGNAEDVAAQLRLVAESRGMVVSLRNMADYDPSHLARETNLAILVSTHGEGDPPDDAEALYACLFSEGAPTLTGVRYAVLALGDVSYEQFCRTGKDFDLRLAALGAEWVRDRVDCDVDYEDAADDWIAGVVTAFGPVPGGHHPEVLVLPDARPATDVGCHTRKNPYPAPVRVNVALNGPGSRREVRHIEMDTRKSGLAWEPGDSLGVIPENDPAVVDELIAALGLNPDERVPGADGETGLRRALLHAYEVTAPTRPFVEQYARLAASRQLDALLAADDHDALAGYLHGRYIIDLVEDYPVTGLSGGEFVRLLRRLPPRLYSIASSHAADPDTIHLMVAAVRYRSHGRERFGVASTHLTDRVVEDDTVPVYIDRNRHFRLPEDGDTPIVMIGPGTGVAPFRAFLAERENLGAAGRNWLFFGVPNRRTDFYYRSDWRRWRERGLLDRLDTAFSRDQVDKVYVQHRMLENAAQLYAWLEEGAHVYVCGDSERMAPAVHDALAGIISGQGGLSADAAVEYLKQLQKAKRYQRDVY